MQPSPGLTPFEDARPSADYAPIYQGLAELREEFHRSGRLDDSNAKLDEVVKLFATYLAVRLGDIQNFPAPVDHPGKDFVARLQACYAKAAGLPYYVCPSGLSIFGDAPSLVLRESDVSLAVRLTRLVIRAVDDAFLHQELGNPYDVLNEAFGHFVRDNFRGNIEDAQYLTPAEVVELMASIALEDLKRDGRLSNAQPLVVADPCCGVGSFLATFAAKYRRLGGRGVPHLKLFGQDKVERMARLTTVNLTLFRVFDHSVSIGNSLYKGSSLDELNGTVDLILTNPPFGARFAAAEIALMAGDNAPFFSMLGRTRAPFESELLFVDRDLRLLREGGMLGIVVPDSVISAGGIAALLRHHLRSTATLRGVIELPSVTFAQAGTRTKTAVLYLKKGRSTDERSRVFMGVSADLGFQVNSRKGVQIKAEKGENDLPAMFAAYRKMHQDGASGEATVLSEAVSAVAIPQSFVHDAWTAGHYQARRLDVLRAMADAPEVAISKLSDLVDFVAGERRVECHRPGVAFLSVLHVIAEGVLDLAAIRTYAPKTPGVPVNPGEILLSRINPRIPRALVVPDLGQPILCSSEFEVMRPKKGVDPYLIAFLLLSRMAQTQIQSLTSGTSASHNRVKTKELAQLSLPVPRGGSESAKQLKRKVTHYRQVLASMMECQQSLVELRENEIERLRPK
jgi:type I restriction-modification system DNA methylase subunit